MNGLDQGANDYITKPFDIEELFARIRAVLRLKQGKEEQNQDVLELGGIRVEKGTREAYRDENSIELTSREFDLLAYLMENKNNEIERENEWIINEKQKMDFSHYQPFYDSHSRYWHLLCSGEDG